MDRSIANSLIGASLCILLGALAVAQPPAAPQKFSTPDECFQFMIKTKDLHESLPCYSEALRNYILGGMAFNLEDKSGIKEYGEASVACEKVLQKYGLYQKDMTLFLQLVDAAPPGEATTGLMQIGASIKDQMNFARDAAAALQQVQRRQEALESKEKAKIDQEVPDALQFGSRLTDLKVEGETASAKILMIDGKEKAERVYFKQEHGSWVVMADEKEPDWKQLIKGRFRFSDYLKAVEIETKRATQNKPDSDRKP